MPEGLADLEAQRAAYLREAVHDVHEDARRLRTEVRRLEKQETRSLDAIKVGLPLAGPRGEAEQIAERRAQIRDRLEWLEALEEASGRRVAD